MGTSTIYDCCALVQIMFLMRMILLLILCHLGFAIKCLEGDQKKSQKVKANKMQDLECPGNQCGRIWNKKTKKLTLQCGAETCTGLNLDEIKLPTISFGRRKRAPGCPNKCQKKSGRITCLCNKEKCNYATHPMPQYFATAFVAILSIKIGQFF